MGFLLPQPLSLGNAAAGEQAACRTRGSVEEKRQQLQESLPVDHSKRESSDGARGKLVEAGRLCTNCREALDVPGTMRQQDTALTPG